MECVGRLELKAADLDDVKCIGSRLRNLRAQRRPDISKAQELLKWAPRTPLKDGLKATIAYFDELLKDQGVRDMVIDVAPASGALAKS